MQRYSAKMKRTRVWTASFLEKIKVFRKKSKLTFEILRREVRFPVPARTGSSRAQCTHTSNHKTHTHTHTHTHVLHNKTFGALFFHSYRSERDQRQGVALRGQQANASSTTDAPHQRGMEKWSQPRCATECEFRFVWLLWHSRQNDVIFIELAPTHTQIDATRIRTVSVQKQVTKLNLAVVVHQRPRSIGRLG